MTEASFLTLESGEQLTVLPHGTPLRSSPLDSLATEVRQLGFSEDQIARGLPLASSLEQFLEWCATDGALPPRVLLVTGGAACLLCICGRMCVCGAVSVRV